LGTIVIAAALMCVCNIIVAPLYASLSGNRLAVLPWVAVISLLTVGFCATVGFAVVWLGDLLGARVRSRYVPLVFACLGFVAFGIWGGFVVASIFDSIVVPAGASPLQGMALWSVAINSAVIGALGFGAGRFIAERKRLVWPFTWTLIIVELLVAGAGIFFLAQVYAFLY
jgi:hypothetical protein